MIEIHTQPNPKKAPVTSKTGKFSEEYRRKIGPFDPLRCSPQSNLPRYETNNCSYSGIPMANDLPWSFQLQSALRNLPKFSKQ